MTRPGLRRSVRLVGSVATGALVVTLAAGCGGLSEDGRKAAGNLSRSFQDAGLTKNDADCVARGWVKGAGEDRLVSSGVLRKDLEPAEHNRKKPGKEIVEPYVDAYFDCVDYGRYEAVKFDKSRPNLIDKTSFAACANAIDKGDAKQAMEDDLLGKETKVSADVQHRLLQCVTAGDSGTAG